MALTISDAVIWQETADGVSLYHTETGAFSTLNETGSKIWMMVEQSGEREPIALSMSRAYARGNDAVSRRIVTEVNQFIGSMVENGMILEEA
ncbi:PqqD family protein [Herbidospora daliensis]|uniref:PqqD family protein n=1 Tax=Herbidospora daliensis TaxID=295585 RepID=UPI000AEAECEB|nr:PqqD family protein [Herbidospora daliensis]